MTVNPVHLRTLTEAVRAGSFAVAARRLGYTGSAVSQQIAQLERALGVPLFEREAHRITATAAAEFLVARSHAVLSSLTALEHDMQGLAAGTAGRLRIGSFPTASERLLPAALARFGAVAPGVEIQLDEAEPEELVVRLQDGDLDLVLGYRYDGVPRAWARTLTAIDLLHEDLVLLLSADHPCHGRDDVELADLHDARWVSTREGTAGAACLAAVCATAGFVPTVGYRSNDYDVIRGFVLARLGSALVPALSYVDDGSVATTELRGETARRHVSALFRWSAASLAVRALVAALRAVAAELAHDSGGRIAAA